MTDARRPYEIIQDMADSLTHLSDDELLFRLNAIISLPNEEDSAWDDERFWSDHCYPYLALADVIASRKLRAAIPLFLDRACYGDPGETMRGLCHCLEAIVEPNYSDLYDPCIIATNSPRAGTRMWALFQLARLRVPRARQTFENALQDEAEYVRSHAEIGLRGLDRETEKDA